MVADTEDAGQNDCQATVANRVERLRDFLTRNKIFFETVAATLLSVMAIIIGVAQVWIAGGQTQLAELQMEVARQQATPQFVAAGRQMYDVGTGTVIEEKIEVHNHGGIVQDLQCNYAVFFDVTFITTTGSHKQEVKIPVNGYYDSIFHTASGKGLVLTLAGHHNNKRVAQLQKEFFSLVSSRNGFGSFSIRRYVRLRYRDIFGQVHVKHYFIDLIRGGKPLTKEEGRKVFDRFEAGFTDGHLCDFGDLTSEEILKRVTAVPGDSSP